PTPKTDMASSRAETSAKASSTWRRSCSSSGKDKSAKSNGEPSVWAVLPSEGGSKISTLFSLSEIDGGFLQGTSPVWHPGSVLPGHRWLGWANAPAPGPHHASRSQLGEAMQRNPQPATDFDVIVIG